MNLRKVELWLECVGLFGVVPYACWKGQLPVIAVLAIFGLVTYLQLRHDHAFDRKMLTRFAAHPAEWKRILTTFIIAFPMLVGLVWLLRPEALFAWPREKTQMWLGIILLYPLVSVWPQEVIYRAFFLRRYEPIFGTGKRMALVNAFAFAFAHIIFSNPIAVFLTFIGGWLFARTLQRTRALGPVMVEHAAYGFAIFTVGLGKYFLQGAPSLVQHLVN